jgi:hypothetical protein
MGSIGRYMSHTGWGAFANIRVGPVEMVRASALIAGRRLGFVFGLKSLLVRPLTDHLRKSASAIGDLIANDAAG